MGSIACGCTSVNREEVLFEHLQMGTEVGKDPLPCINSLCRPEESDQTEPTENAAFEIQGELCRVQKSAKERLVPRWCVLNMNFFKYFKNKFSAACGESPLFEIPIGKIICGRVYEKEGRFCIEINFFKESATVGVWKERGPLREIWVGRNVQKVNRKETVGVECENRIEVIVFVISSKAEWTKWSRGLLSCIKHNLNY